MNKADRYIILFFILAFCCVFLYFFSDGINNADVVSVESTAALSETESTTDTEKTECSDSISTFKSVKASESNYEIQDSSNKDSVTGAEDSQNLSEITEKYVNSEDTAKSFDTEESCSEQTTEITYDIINVTTESVVSDVIINSDVSGRYSESFKSFGKTYSGSLSSSDDTEEFSFYVQERGYISFVLSHESFTGIGGWLVTVENEYYLNGSDGETSFRKISTLICESGKTKHNSVNIGVIPGNYRIIVSPYIKTVNSQFSLCVSFTAGSDYEIECNDTKSRYTEFYPGKPVYGAASFADSTDSDWYMFRMYSDGVININFEHSAVDVATVLWKISMYDSNGNELYSENSFGSSKLTDSGCIGLISGVYYVKVESRVYSNVVYTLTAERVSTGKYEKEANDTQNDATVGTLGTVIYGNSASRQSSSDKDYYKFTVNESGIIVLTFSHDEITSDKDKKAWNIILTNSSGTVLYYSECYYFRSKIVSPNIGLPAGTYYVCVDCDNCYRVDTDYGVLLTFKSCTNYETEINNSHAKADSVVDGRVISGNLTKGKSDYDKDCYVLNLSKTGKVDFTFTHTIVNSDRIYYSISLYDSTGSKVNFYTATGSMCKGNILCAGNDNSLKFSTELAAGKYYIDISVGDYYSDGIYTICYKETVY